MTSGRDTTAVDNDKLYVCMHTCKLLEEVQILDIVNSENCGKLAIIHLATVT